MRRGGFYFLFRLGRGGDGGGLGICAGGSMMGVLMYRGGEEGREGGKGKAEGGNSRKRRRKNPPRDVGWKGNLAHS